MLLFLIITASFLLSFLSKLLADHFLSERLAVIRNFVGLVPSHNPGIAFGVRFPPLLQTLLIAAATIVVAFLARKAKTLPAKLGFGLILGGALANIADRIRDGLVTDFFQVGTFPIFNVADSCITIGVIVLLLDGLLLSRKPRAS